MTGPGRPRVMIARSFDGNGELSPRLRAMGMTPVPISTVEFLEPSDWSEVDKALAHIDGFDWVGLTSPRGAALFARRMRELGVRPAKTFPRIAGVGEMTADAIKREGFEVGFVPSEFTTAALGRQLPARLGRKVLLLRAEKAGQEILATLRRRGFSVTSIPIYRTRTIRRRYRGTRLGDTRAVLLGSPSEVEGLVKRLNPGVLDTLRTKALAICIGPVTGQAARKAGFEHVVMPRVHTFDALLMEARRSVVR